jgi:hypothetical protein
MESGAFRSTSNKRCRVALPYPDEMREMGALVGKGESIWATKGQQTGRSPDEPGRAPVLIQSRIPSPDELHRTHAAVYETEGHRFESCRARFRKSRCSGISACWRCHRWHSIGRWATKTATRRLSGGARRLDRFRELAEVSAQSPSPGVAVPRHRPARGEHAFERVESERDIVRTVKEVN